MQQTLLALLALMTAMLISLNQQRATVSAQIELLAGEVMSVATTVGLDFLEEASLLAFDQQTIDAEVTTVYGLTSPPFSTGKPYASADDLDDLHEMQTHTVDPGLEGLLFEVDAVVRYVDEGTFAPTTTRTFAKELIVTVDNRFLPNPVELSRVFTYP